MGKSSRAAKSRRRFLQALAGAPVLACSGLSSASQVGPTIDVTSLGADPTGGMDSADAVQQAVDLLPAWGGTVFFPPGDYLMRPKPSPLEDHYNRWPREHISFAAVELRRLEFPVEHVVPVEAERVRVAEAVGREPVPPVD